LLGTGGLRGKQSFGEPQPDRSAPPQAPPHPLAERFLPLGSSELVTCPRAVTRSSVACPSTWTVKPSADESGWARSVRWAPGRPRWPPPCRRRRARPGRRAAGPRLWARDGPAGSGRWGSPRRTPRHHHRMDHSGRPAPAAATRPGSPAPRAPPAPAVHSSDEP
jgi:hypothetical protein